MRLERRDGYWLLIGGPVPPGSSAITVGPVISIRARAVGSARLLRHELVHVAQWRRLGVTRFLVGYLGHYVLGRLRGWPHKAAYRRIPHEVEAEWLAIRHTDGATTLPWSARAA